MKTLRALILGAGLVLASTGHVRADSSTSGEGELGVEEVLRSVDRSFPLIAAAVREQDEAKGALLSSEGGFDPSLRASGTVEPISGYQKQYFTTQVDQPTAVGRVQFEAGDVQDQGGVFVHDLFFSTTTKLAA